MILDGQPMMEVKDGDEHEDDEILLVVIQVSSIVEAMPVI